MKVAVGSKNAVKIRVAEIALSRVWPHQEHDVRGFNVSSNVSDQPLTLDETEEGAYNRAHGALDAWPEAELGIGMEGGMFEQLGRDLECGVIRVFNRDEEEGYGRTATFEVPQLLMEHIRAGLGLNQAMEAATGEVDIGSREGFFGYMTNKAVDRTSAYADAVAVALSRFVHPELFE